MQSIEGLTTDITVDPEETKVLESTKITEEIIRVVGDKIARAFNPEKIIVFGSAVTGDPDKAHDLDVLVVMESDATPDQRDMMIDDLLWGRFFDLDPFVYTPEEFQQAINANNSFIKKIISTGRVLYERKPA